MNMAKFFSKSFPFKSCSLVGATHKEVVTCALAVTRGLVRARPPTWLHVGMSHVNTYDTTHSRDSVMLLHLTCQEAASSLSSSLTLAAASLVILDFSLLILSLGVINRLYELVS
jgi:hypothetical protein